MVRDHPWIIAAAVFTFGVIAWVVVAERPPKSPVRIEASRTLAAEPELPIGLRAQPLHADRAVIITRRQRTGRADGSELSNSQIFGGRLATVAHFFVAHLGTLIEAAQSRLFNG